MRLIYADPGIRDEVGHHANFCRTIRNELLRRGIEVVVLTNTGVSADLRVQIDAQPLFRAYTYWQTDGDPIAGWLNCFQSSTSATVADLRRLSGLKADDLVYCASAQPAQFMALVTWVKTLPMERRPHVVIEFATDPGVDFFVEDGQQKIRLRDYRTDPRAMFYRHAACQLTEADMRRFHVITFDPASSAVYTQILGKPVGALPPPTLPPPQVQSRVGRNPVTVAVLGHQRPDKGYHLMPEIARLLLAHEPDIRLLVHNGAPDDLARVQQEMRAHAAVEPRLTLNEESAGATFWPDLLARSDLMLCPYEPARYVASHSGVVIEALANAIPVVVPGGTALSRQLAQYGSPGSAFETQTAASIVAATRRILADFDGFAARALDAARQWNASMGVANMVAGLLAFQQADEASADVARAG